MVQVRIDPDRIEGRDRLPEPTEASRGYLVRQSETGRRFELAEGETLFAPVAPGEPAVAGAATSLEVAWLAPSDGGSPITAYSVEYRASAATAWTEWAHTGTGRTATITGLATGTAYDVRVRATNAIGDGRWSPVAQATTVEPVPASLGTPTLTRTSAATNASRYAWTAVAGATHYELNNIAVTNPDAMPTRVTANTSLAPRWRNQFQYNGQDVVNALIVRVRAIYRDAEGNTLVRGAWSNLVGG